MDERNTGKRGHRVRTIFFTFEGVPLQWFLIVNSVQLLQRSFGAESILFILYEASNWCEAV